MRREQHHITEFMVAAEQEVPQMPGIPSRETCELRVRLIAEELLELCDALDVDVRLIRNRGDGTRICGVSANPNDYVPAPVQPVTNLRDAYDGVIDILVVTIGTGIALGLDIEPGWDEVQRSNMSKFIDGHKREDGKWVKGPSYSPAKLQPIIDAQIAEARRKQSAETPPQRE